MNERENGDKLDELRRLHEADPSDTAVATRLAQLYVDMGWYNEAADLYAALIERCPDDFGLLLDYGNLCYQRKDYAAATTCFTRLTVVRPSRVEGWNNLGILALALHDEKRARECFEHVLLLEPDNAGALLNLGCCLFDDGDRERAAELFEKVVVLAPDNADGWFNLGNVRRERGEYAQAIEAYGRSLRYRPGFSSAHKNIGCTRELMGELETAECCYREALELNRTDAQLHRNLGMLCLRQGRVDEARECLRGAVRLAPRDMDGWMGLRECALLKGDLTTYVKATLAVISRLSPDDCAAACATVRGFGQHEGAEAILDAADSAQKRSDSLDAQRILSSFRRQGRSSSVVALEKRLLSSSGLSDGARGALARYLFESGQAERALRICHPVPPGEVHMLFLSWEIALALGRGTQVQQQVQEYLRTNQDDGDSWLLLAGLLCDAGEREKAREALLRALECGITTHDPLAARPQLRQLYDSLSPVTGTEPGGVHPARGS